MEACAHCGAALVARHAVTSAELEFGTISWHREMAAIEALVAGRGTEGLSVESIAVRAYRKKSNPTVVSSMISIGLGNDAIVRFWCRHYDGRWWRGQWSMLGGDSPAPGSLEETYARRHELVRPAAVTIERDVNFWRLVDADYGDEEGRAAPASALAGLSA